MRTPGGTVRIGPGGVGVAAPGVKVKVGDRAGRARRQDPGQRTAPSLPPGHYRRARPVSCLGNSSIVLRNRWIRTRGVAVSTMGNCGVTLVNCWIEAGSDGVNAMGNGTIRIRNCFIRSGGTAVNMVGNGNVHFKGSTIRGKAAALHVTGNGRVYTRNTRFKGGIKRLGTGSFKDLGGNVYRSR